MEDRSSHNRFCSPANRFYEYISSGSLVLFDSHCKKTFDQAGVDIEPYIVNSPADVKEKMLNNALRKKQRLEMYEQTNYKANLDAEFAVLLDKAGL
jgi:hypothetical protein